MQQGKNNSSGILIRISALLRCESDREKSIELIALREVTTYILQDRTLSEGLSEKYFTLLRSPSRAIDSFERNLPIKEVVGKSDTPLIVSLCIILKSAGAWRNHWSEHFSRYFSDCRAAVDLHLSPCIDWMVVLVASDDSLLLILDNRQARHYCRRLIRLHPSCAYHASWSVHVRAVHVRLHLWCQTTKSVDEAELAYDVWSVVAKSIEHYLSIDWNSLTAFARSNDLRRQATKLISELLIVSSYVDSSCGEIACDSWRRHSPGHPLDEPHTSVEEYDIGSFVVVDVVL